MRRKYFTQYWQIRQNCLIEKNSYDKSIFSVQPSRAHRVPARTARVRTRAVVWTTVLNQWATGVFASDHGSDPPAQTQVPLLVLTVTV